jgi:GH35 family endo-1,4-beta-xylanase
MNHARGRSNRDAANSVEARSSPKLLLVSTVILLLSAAVAGCGRKSSPPEGGPRAFGFVQGDYAFVPHERQVLVINIARPAEPKTVTAWNVPGRVQKVVLEDHYAFVVHSPSVESWNSAAGPPDGGIQIVDITDPMQPEPRGLYRTPDLAEDIALIGDTAYVADWSGLRIVDISDRGNPRETSSIAQGIGSIKAIGDRLFGSWGGCSIRGWCSGGFWSADVAVPAQPTEIGTVKPDDLPGYDVAITGDFAYVGGMGVWLIDLSDPSQPSFAGHFALPEGAYRSEVETTDSYLYLSSGDLRVIDLSETPALHEVGYLDLPSTFVMDMALRDSFVYLAADGGLYVIDVTNPRQPRLVGQSETNPIPPPSPSPTPVALNCERFSPQGSQLDSAIHVPPDPNLPLPPLASAPEPRYAVHTLFLDNALAAMATDIGFDSVVQVFPWRDLNPAPGIYAWDASDYMVRVAREHGLNLVVRLDMPPQWARLDNVDHGLPFEAAAYADFVSAVAERYSGYIAGYIIWNEPNLSAEWSRSGEAAADHWSSQRGWVADPADYVGILGLAFDRIHTADPTAVVITAGLAPTNEDSARAQDERSFLRGMMEAGAADCFDVLGVHAYGFGLDPADADDSQNGLDLARIRDLREIMMNAGLNKPMWITELGYTIGSDGSSGGGHPAVSPDQQAQYLVNALARSRDEWPWVELLTIWNLSYGGHSEAGGFSLIQPDMTPRPSYVQLRTFLGSGDARAMSDGKRLIAVGCSQWAFGPNRTKTETAHAMPTKAFKDTCSIASSE